MIKNLLIIILLAVLSSCGTINKLKNKEASKTDSTATIKTDSSSLVKTASTKTVTERADTSITPKKDSITTEVHIDKLLDGDTNTVKTDNFEIKTYVDKKTNKIKTKVVSSPDPVKFSINRTTIEKKEEEKNTNLKKEAKVSLKKESKKTEIKKEIKPWWAISCWWLLLLLIPAYIYLRKKISFLP